LRILLVRLRLIGDVVFTTPVIRSLRRHFPDAHLTYVVEPAAAPVVDGNPHLDELIVAPRRRGLSRLADDLRLGRRLRRGRYDIAIDLHGGPRGAFLVWMSDAPMRIGYTIRGRRWMYTHVVGRSPELIPRHSVQNQGDLLRPLGIDACDPGSEPVEMREDARATRAVAARLAAAGVGPSDPIAVVHVSAGNPFRRWPADSFAELAAALVRRGRASHVVLVSGPSESAAAEAIARDARQRLGVEDHRVSAGDYDLAELRALVARAAVYIGGDSGPLHVASTTTTPIVLLLGPTLPERSRPWRDARWFTEIVDAGPLPCRPCNQRRCEPGDFRCLSRIPAGRVVDAAERAIASTTRSSGDTGALACLAC
jgi:predicted lipopolysaccharide heptosyltransferase III